MRGLTRKVVLFTSRVPVMFLRNLLYWGYAVGTGCQPCIMHRVGLVCFLLLQAPLPPVLASDKVLVSALEG